MSLYLSIKNTNKLWEKNMLGIQLSLALSSHKIIFIRYQALELATLRCRKKPSNK